MIAREYSNSRDVTREELRRQYLAGFEMHVAEVFRGVAVNLAAMTPAQRRGYDAACRAEADAGASAYLVAQANRNGGAA